MSFHLLLHKTLLTIQLAFITTSFDFTYYLIKLDLLFNGFLLTTPLDFSYYSINFHLLLNQTLLTTAFDVIYYSKKIALTTLL